MECLVYVTFLSHDICTFKINVGVFACRLVYDINLGELWLIVWISGASNSWQT